MNKAEERFVWVASPDGIMASLHDAVAHKFLTKRKRFKFAQKVSLDVNGYIVGGGNAVGWVLKDTGNFTQDEWYILTDKLRRMLTDDMVKGDGKLMIRHTGQN